MRSCTLLPLFIVQKQNSSCLLTECEVKLPAHRAELPGNVDIIIGSALTPLRESVTALPAPAIGRKAGHPADLPVKWITPSPIFVFLFVFLFPTSLFPQGRQHTKIPLKAFDGTPLTI